MHCNNEINNALNTKTYLSILPIKSLHMVSFGRGMPKLSTFSERRRLFLWNFITSARISTKISSVKYESDALGVLEEVVIDEAILYVESIRVHCLGH